VIAEQINPNEILFFLPKNFVLETKEKNIMPGIPIKEDITIELYILDFN